MHYSHMDMFLICGGGGGEACCVRDMPPGTHIFARIFGVLHCITNIALYRVVEVGMRK